MKRVAQVKKDYAKTLYLNGITQKEIAAQTGLAESTVSRYVKPKDKGGEGWGQLKAGMVTSKAENIARMQNLLNDLLAKIDKKGKAETGDIDSISKLTTAIERLEREINVTTAVNVMIGFCDYVRKAELESAKEISSYADSYLNSLVK